MNTKNNRKFQETDAHICATFLDLLDTHDFDNNGYIDFYAIAPKDVQTERGIWGYMIYQLPGHKFEIKKYDHDANDYGFGLEQAVGANSELFLANTGILQISR